MKKEYVFIGLGLLAAYLVYENVVAPVTKPVTGAVSLVSNLLLGVESAAADLESGAGAIWDDLTSFVSAGYSKITGGEEE